MVHPAVKAVDLSSGCPVGERSQHRISRRATDAFADAIGDANGKDLRPRGSQRDGRTHRGGDAVAEQHEWALRPRPIREPTRDDLQDTGDSLSGALDHPERVATLTLVAIDRSAQTQPQAFKSITPTLEVAPLDAVNGQSFAMQPNESGAYVAAGRFFPKAGEWRMRVLVDWGEGEPHSVLIVVDAH
jgi:hypothetical protein